MADALHRYSTGHEAMVLCEACVRRRRQAGGRCEWAETPTDREQAALSCQDCGATVEPLPQPEPPDLETLMEWMEGDGGCEAACPHGCWVEPDGTCPHGKPSWLIVLGLI